MSARILVVDDIPANVRLLEAKLAAEYFEVVSASSGKEALELIDKQIPDIVLLDVMMPEMDGFEVCARIRANPKTHFLPVVMVTALSDPSDRVRGLEAGADDFLTKPVNDLALFARVRSLVRLKMIMDEWRMREQTSGQFDLLTAATEPDQNEDRNASVLLVEGFAPAAQRIVQVLSKDGDKVEVCESLGRAQELATSNRFDLIITNIQVGGEDGLRLCSHLRSQEETRQTPILLIVEEFDMPRLIKGLDIGASDYLMKPIDPNELLARVRIQIRRRRYQDRLRANYERSLSLALTDSLTGLYNRRYAMRHMEGLMERVKESGKALSVLVCDLDHFKNVNDTYGHAAGDEVLKQFAQRATASMRNFDMVARTGGEEFVCLLPDTDGQSALKVAERLCRRVAETPMKVDGAPNGELTVTVSIGLAATSRVMSGEELLKVADAALYRAKQSGRNRVMADPSAML
ncbi:response regulator receiver modulated diguanylate cyclase [Dongia mobilis]|uniref:diguanylate cyclase n=1 Tax=Dongia mobilis TaxID=578943 RepID=A0A4R6WPP0_9PROT|nr:PleD family two-component system response regulator [Dongia mobilis]TDQ81449.1 response regulator receiver modulated diguanylate cyclase [Dongia mobilis]